MEARKVESIYVVYKQDEYVGEGTANELAELTGMTATYIRSLVNRPKVKKWTVERKVSKLEAFIDIEKVNYNHLAELMKEHNYKPAEIENVTGMLNIYHKLAKRSRFQYTDIELLEDLFFLEEGELLNG